MENLREYVAFDLEFNTVDGKAHLIQLSAVKMVDHKEVDSFDSYVYSSVPLQSFINGLTGITKKDIDQAPPKDEVLVAFSQFIGEFPLIGYNAQKSDLPILAENGLELEARYLIDVYEEAKERRSSDLNGIDNLKLQTVARTLGIAGKGHDSLEDARMTAQVYEHFLDLDVNKRLLEEQETVTNNLFADFNLIDFFD